MAEKTGMFFMIITKFEILVTDSTAKLMMMMIMLLAGQ